MFDLRLRKLRHFLKEKKLDVLLISNFYSILYLTGLKTLAPDEREAFAVVSRRNIYLISDGRYLHSEEKRDGITPRILTPEKKLSEHLGRIIREEKIKRLGFEMEDLKVDEYGALRKKLGVRLIPVNGSVSKLRVIKDEEEIKKIKRTCAVAEKCLREVIKTVKIGQTEKEIAFKIEFWLKRKGYDISFAPIVAVGANAAVPHYNTQMGNGKVKKGSVLLIDYGAKVDDYCSDATRMFFVGKPKDELVNIYRKLLDGQEKTIEFVEDCHSRPDRESADPRFCEDDSGTLKSVDLFCRQQLEKNDLANFPHSTGHGVGLEVHEGPSVSFKSKDTLQTNQVFTIEPGVYKAGEYGMRIEDMIWVKKKSVEVLTKLPKSVSSIIL